MIGEPDVGVRHVDQINPLDTRGGVGPPTHGAACQQSHQQRWSKGKEARKLASFGDSNHHRVSERGVRGPERP